MLKRLLTLFIFLLLAIPAFATISTTQNSITLSATGSGYTYNFPFVADSANDIYVYVTNSSGAQTTLLPSQYTVSINPPATNQLWGVGGFITYPLIGSPLAIGNTVTISRLLPLYQATDLANQGDFYPSVVEQALDTNVMQTQQVSSRTGMIRGDWTTSTMYNYGDIVVDGANGADTGNLYMCALANTSSTWSTDLANGDWSLALNVQSIVNALPTIGNNQLFGNISGGTATPNGVGGSAFFDSVFGNTQGDILYRSGSQWTVLPPGTTGQILTTHGAGSNPTWSSSSGTGTVTSVTCGAGLSGGTITSAGTCSITTQADATVLANTSGSSGVPTATTLSALFDYIFGSTQGSILYRGGTLWSLLGPGTSGQVLETQGAAANPQWASIGSSNVQTFTTSGTWTKPAGGTKTFVQCWGGGGSGGVGSGGASAGGGGANCNSWFNTSALSSTTTVTIGAGGAGATGTAGNNGGNSTFGVLLTAYGGGGAGSGNTGGGGGGCLSAGSAPNGGNPLESTSTGVDNSGFGGGNGSTTGNGGNGGYGGGGGGGINPGNGGSSIYGGGGGGGVSGGSAGSAGTSEFGGAGGAGTTGASGNAGTQPGGGGGASKSGTSGKGADGECIVTTFP